MKTAKNNIPIILLVAFLILLSCKDKSTNHQNPLDSNNDSLQVLIESSGKTFQLGSGATIAAADEKPPMTICFTYNYSIDLKEVTRGLYNRTMNTGGSLTDSLPINNITWYDAILFCNKRSRLEQIDSVYSYLAKTISPAGNVIQIEGLTVHLDKPGYRLPTEAEWEFAARGGTQTDFFWGDIQDSLKAPQYAWYQSNAGGFTHPAGSLLPNSYGLFDMTGNVAEWTNDWKGAFQDTTYVNFCGAFSPNTQYERIIKGGAFLNGINSLRSSCRGEVYATLSSSKGEYIGFRCVKGTIASPEYLASENYIPSSQGNICTTRESVRSFFGTTRVRLCYIGSNRNVLSFVDFNEETPEIHQFYSTVPIFHPSISPDGTKLTFCTQNEGNDGPCAIYIRTLDPSASTLTKVYAGPGYIPRWWVNPQTQDTFLIFTTSGMANSDSLQWSTTKTFKLKITGNQIGGIPVLLSDQGGFHDGFSCDGSFLVTGFERLRELEIATGRIRTLFTSPENGKDSLGSIQVCNVSISPHLPSQIAFLDLGYSRTSCLTGTAYLLHSYLFISDMNGHIQKWFFKPGNSSGWDGCEWSNQSAFIVAGTDNQTTLSVLNIRNGSRIQMVTGEQLRQPGIWIEDTLNTETTLNLDSLGLYNDPASDQWQREIASKMPSFWKYCDSVDAFGVGSSQMQDGIDPREIHSVSMYNLGFGAGDLMSASILIRNYILVHAQKTKLICISLDPGWLNYKDGSRTWKTGMANTKGYNYDMNHFFWRGGLPNNFYNYIQNASNPHTGLDINNQMGHNPGAINGWGFISCDTSGNNWDTTSSNYKENIELIRGLGQELAARGIDFLVINFPMSPDYKTSACFGPFGPSWNTANGIIAQMRKLESENSYFHFYDAYNGGINDYNDGDASNSNHLSQNGAIKLSRRIDSLLQIIF